MAGRLTTSAFRWFSNFDLALSHSISLLRSSISFLRWPPQFMSSSPSSSASSSPTATSSSFYSLSPRWAPRRLMRWPQLDFSIVDEVVWGVVTAVESVALVSMLCFFFLFCGCTV